MTLRTDIDGDKSRVRLSLAQLWAILATIAGAGFIVGGGLVSIKGDLAVQTQALREMKLERIDSLREWSRWREEVNRTNTSHDVRLMNLEKGYK